MDRMAIILGQIWLKQWLDFQVEENIKTQDVLAIIQCQKLFKNA